MKRRTIKVDQLARVEGEGGLSIRIRDNKVVDARLNIFEPPRFFEAFLRGRAYHEAPDITARICGICPVAYQMSSVHAMESALGIEVSGSLRLLRRLIYCGEWIESHVLHVYMLHLPDFLGYPDAIALAKDHPQAVERGLRLKKTGNEIVTLLGGREIHPINRFVATLDFPEFERDYEFVALRHPDEYPFNEGRLVSNKGLDIAIKDYERHFQEEHVAHSTALHAQHVGHGAYFTGPMARYALNFDRLPSSVQEAARAAGLDTVCRNPFKSIIVRSLETMYACEEALRIIDAYEEPDLPAVAIEPRAGSGCGCTEAPRGILFHRYRLDSEGIIRDARIVAPTSQNQMSIEEDLRAFVNDRIDLDDERLTWECEQAVRNYDPCISCSAHFLKLNVDRE